MKDQVRRGVTRLRMAALVVAVGAGGLLGGLVAGRVLGDARCAQRLGAERDRAKLVLQARTGLVRDECLVRQGSAFQEIYDSGGPLEDVAFGLEVLLLRQPEAVARSGADGSQSWIACGGAEDVSCEQVAYLAVQLGIVQERRGDSAQATQAYEFAESAFARGGGWDTVEDARARQLVLDDWRRRRRQGETIEGLAGGLCRSAATDTQP